MILSFIYIRKVPREMLKTSGFALGFQHLPRDFANVNEWKIMFDPYIRWYVCLSIFEFVPEALTFIYTYRPGNTPKRMNAYTPCIYTYSPGI